MRNGSRANVASLAVALAATVLASACRGEAPRRSPASPDAPGVESSVAETVGVEPGVADTAGGGEQGADFPDLDEVVARPDGSAAGLAAFGRAFYMAMAADDPQLNRRAMQVAMPTENDFELLLPDGHEAAWRVWGPEAEAMLADAPELSARYREGLPIVDVEIRDLRSEAAESERESLEMLPPDVPVYGGIITLERGDQRPAKSFVFLRGRWVWIWNLERLATVSMRMN